MEKKEVQKIVKEKLKSIGFTVKGNVCHKIIDDDYLVGVWLDHDPYSKGYFIEYGAVYLPDEDKIPFNGFCDWDDRFLFTQEPGADLEKYPIQEIEYDEDEITECFDYIERTSEDLTNQLEINIQKKLALLDDKEYVLKYYLNNLDLLARLPENTLKKLLGLYCYDRAEINRLRSQWGYDKFVF